MKKHIKILKSLQGVQVTLLICLMIGTMSAQAPAIEWQKSLGGSSIDFARSVAITNDGGYIVAGTAISNDGDVSGNHGQSDFWITKLSSTGSLQWQKCLGGPGGEQCEDIKQTSDGGYILIGYSSQNGGDVTGNHGVFDYWVVKITSNGDLEWQRSLGGSLRDEGYSVLQTNDGGYIIAGGAESSDGDVGDAIDYLDFWVVKLSSVGNIEWEKSLGGSDYDVAYSIQQTPDGGFIVAGTTKSTNGMVTGNHGLEDFWVAKISDAGILQWQKTYGGSQDDVAVSIINTSDGGYAVAGYTASTDGDVSGNHGSQDFWVIKINNSGTLQWQKTLGGSGPEIAYDIVQQTDGGFVVIGETFSNNGDVSGNNGQSDVWLARLDPSGTLLWREAFGGSDEDSGHSLQKTSDGGFIFAATSRSNNGDVSGNNGSTDYWVVKLSPDPLETSEFDSRIVVLYPNPAADILYVEASEEIERIRIYNILGQIFYDKTHQSAKISLNTEGFSEGIYMVEIVAGNYSEVYKIIKE